ncbi:MAG: PKD domain-containing protein [Methanoregula sp.]
MIQKNYLYAMIAVMLLALVLPGACASSSSESGYITVGLAPVANFDALYAYNTVPATVAFRDHSTGTTPLTYLWEFGDGATSSGQNPSHNYIRQGLYTVKLTVTNMYGSSSEIKTNYIAIGLAPRADFTGQPTTGNTPLTAEFTDRSTGHPTSWYWNFGDGKDSTEQSPVHTYFSSGEFTVTMTASNEYGSSYVSKAYFIHAIPVLRSRFVAEPKTGKAPLVVKFTDTSTGNPETWNWDFGDGTRSAQPNPVHTYTTPGAFDVSLIVTNGMNKDTSLQTIVAGGVPVTDFIADRTTVAVNTPVHFADKTLNSPASWSWNFGDGVSATEQNPAHAYLVKGIYTVTLTATNNNGEHTEKKVNYITVGVVPAADFITEIPSYQEGTRTQYVRFIDTSAGNPTSWFWDFGDGQNSSEQVPPLHLYNKDGTYTVSLTVKNVFGENTMVKSSLITVREGPRVDFTADRTRVSVNQYVRFTDLSTNSPSDWKWDFGDGTAGTGQNPDHAYHQPGIYSVTLTASDIYTSISHTKRNYITVVNTPHSDFSSDKTKGITPFTVKFTDLSTGSPTQWAWDFGDGGTSSEQNPAHIYTTFGSSSTSRYTVTLTATNANGFDDEKKVDYITVTQTPIAEFTVDSRQGKAPFIVKFHDLSAGNPTTWLWEFGDGSTSSEQNPTHLYPFEGSYDVRLSVSNQFGTDIIFKTGTTSQRGNAAPVPLTTSATLQPTTAPVTAVTTIITTTAPTTIPSATQAPVSPFAAVVASVIGLLAIAAAKQK